MKWCQLTGVPQLQVEKMGEEIRHNEDWIDRHGVREGVEDASFDKLIELGTGDGPESAAAAHFLRRRGIPIRQHTHRFRNRDLAGYWTSDNSPFDLSGKWTPQVDYFAEPTRNGVKVGFKLRTGTGFEVISREEYPETWTTHPKYMRAVKQSLNRIVSAFESKEGSPLSLLSEILSIRQSASEQRDRYASEGAKLLKKVRGALNALVHIGIGDLEQIPSTPSSDYILDTYPTREGNRDKVQRQRKLIAEKYSPASLFRVELEKLWDFIRKREKSSWHFSSIMGDAGIPERVTKQSRSVITSLYRDLKSVDEQIVRPASLEIACTVVEAKIVEANRLPTVKEVMPDVSPTYHNRTIWAGDTLKHYKDREGQLPPLDDYRDLKEWLASHVSEPPGADPVGPESHGQALKATGCWHNKRSGATEGLDKTIQAAIRYAKDNNER